MSKLTLPDFQALAGQLQQAQLAVTPAELHGLLTGMLSGGLAADDTRWQLLLADYTNDGMSWPVAVTETAGQMLKVTADELGKQHFELTLLLADEQADLFGLADGVSEWVNHFISGLGLVDAQLDKAPEDVKEVLADLEEIARLGIDEDDDLEEQAQLMEQVIEHIKVCVMTVHLELGAKAKPQDKPTIH